MKISERVIAGKTYSARPCGSCGGTGRTYDSTNADKVNAGPFAGRCSCRTGEVLTCMPDAGIAEGLAHEINNAIIARQNTIVGEMPEWMC